MDFHAQRTCARRTERIRTLNDQLRKTGSGGKMFITAAVARLPPEAMAALMLAVRQFDDFMPANDPHGEHDFGSLTVDGESFFFNTDYYDLYLEHGSSNPADESVTRRILTIMTGHDL